MEQIRQYKKIAFWLMFIALLVFSFSCKKDKDSITTNLYVIKGTALFKDYYKGSSDLVPFANKPVFIRVDTTGSGKDTSNYFYTVQTGNDGRFSFYITDTSLHYELFTFSPVINSDSYSPNYYGSVITSLSFNSNNDYQLIATVDTVYENGLNIITQDINGERIPNAQVFIYSSQIIAVADSSFSGTGNIYKFNTDSLGKGFVSNLPAGNIYINSVLTLTDTTNLKLLHAVSNIQLNRIVTETLTLQ